MARPVLTSFGLILLLTVACGQATAPRRAALGCDGNLDGAPTLLQAEYPRLRTDVEQGPFYRAAHASLGAPQRCRRGGDDRGLWLAFEFPRGGTLTARIDPRIELSEQQLTLPSLAPAHAQQLLRQMERHAFGVDGCGIAWDAPPSEQLERAQGMREVAYRGETCNCQGRLFLRGETLLSLLFRSAC